MTFKHNQRVKCEIEGVKIEDARISIDEDGTQFICQNLKDGLYADNKLGYEYSWVLKKDFTGNFVTNLRPAEKSFDYPEIGDEYKDGNGNSRFVLGVAGRVIHLSSICDKDSYGASYTKEELIKYRYTIVQDEPVEEVEELTMDEVCKELGRTIKIKK